MLLEQDYKDYNLSEYHLVQCNVLSLKSVFNSILKMIYFYVKSIIIYIFVTMCYHHLPQHWVTFSVIYIIQVHKTLLQSKQ